MDLKSTIIPIKALVLEAVAGEQAVPCVGTGDNGPPPVSPLVRGWSQRPGSGSGRKRLSVLPVADHGG